MKKNNEYGSIAELSEGNFTSPEKVFHFKLLQTNPSTSYALDSLGMNKIRSVNPAYTFKMEEKIFCDKKKKTRYIRHVVGEPSIYVDEQPIYTKENPAQVTNLIFINGDRQIQGNDNTLLEYLSVSNYNISNPKRDKTVTPMFYLYDQNAQINTAIANDKSIAKAMGFIYNPEYFDVVMAYGCVSLNGYENMTSEQIQFKLSGMAKKDPSKFMSGIQNPLFLKKYYIKEIAINAGVVTYVESQNALYLQGNVHLLTAPIGTDPVDLFVDNTLSDTSGEWERMYQKVLGLINRGKKVTKEVAPAPPPIDDEELKPVTFVSLPTPTNISDEYADKLIDDGIANGLFTKSGTAVFIYKADSVKNAIKFTGRKGEKGLRTRLQTDQAFLDAVKEEVLTPYLG